MTEKIWLALLREKLKLDERLWRTQRSRIGWIPADKRVSGQSSRMKVEKVDSATGGWWFETTLMYFDRSLNAGQRWWPVN